MNMAKLLSETAEKYPDKTAVVFKNQAWTFRELDREIRCHVSFLEKNGVQKNDRVALQLPKGMEFICLHFALLSMGAASLPLNPAFTPGETEYFLNDSRSFLYITTNEKYEQMKPVLSGANGTWGGKIHRIDVEKPSSPPHTPTYPTKPDDIAVLCYTSGTTGKPKGAMITHRNLVTNTRALHTLWQWSKNDILLHVLPLFHVHGLMVALQGALFAGATTILHEKFDADLALATIEKFQCTVFMGVPTIYNRLVRTFEKNQTDIRSMRLFTSGSAPLSEPLFHRFEKATGRRILERYGMTETQMITSNPYEKKGRIPLSVGYPLPDVHIRVVDDSNRDVLPESVGEVWVKGPNVCRGYWEKPDKNAESFTDGWFKTGDLGYLDPCNNMRLYLSGRAKELIITGGENVYPKEVENVLEEHENIAEAAVVGYADDDLGERVFAFVVYDDRVGTGFA